MPEALVYHFSLQLLAIVGDMHRCQMLHADIKPDNVMVRPMAAAPYQPPDDWHATAILEMSNRSDWSTIKLIDFGRCVDLSFYPERTAFLHIFHDDKCPEMRDGRAWSYQVI